MEGDARGRVWSVAEGEGLGLMMSCRRESRDEGDKVEGQNRVKGWGQCLTEGF